MDLAIEQKIRKVFELLEKDLNQVEVVTKCFEPVEGYPDELIALWIYESQRAGNKGDVSTFVENSYASTGDGGFGWYLTPEGHVFWEMMIECPIYCRAWFENVMYTGEKLEQGNLIVLPPVVRCYLKENHPESYERANDGDMTFQRISRLIVDEFGVDFDEVRYRNEGHIEKALSLFEKKPMLPAIMELKDGRRRLVIKIEGSTITFKENGTIKTETF